MTDAVQEARAKARETIAHWQLARRGINDPSSIPDRLDQMVLVADRVLARINQDIVTETDAILNELSALRFREDFEGGPSTLEQATLMLEGALGRLSRAASLLGFAKTEHDLGLPSGIRIPVEAISHQLDRFVRSIESVQPVLEEIERKQSEDRQTNAKQSALVGHLISGAWVKIGIISAKTHGIESLDVSGVLGLARQLTRLMQSFLTTVIHAVSRLSKWLQSTARNGLGPKISLITVETSELARRAAAAINESESAKIILPILIESMGGNVETANDVGKVIGDGLGDNISGDRLIFRWDELDDYLRLVQDRRAILAIHDLNVGPVPSSQREAIALLKEKVRDVKRRVDETILSLDHRVDLFWTVVTMRLDIPFAKSSKLGLQNVAILPFRWASNKTMLVVDPKAYQIYINDLKKWSASVGPESTFP